MTGGLYGGVQRFWVRKNIIITTEGPLWETQCTTGQKLAKCASLRMLVTSYSRASFLTGQRHRGLRAVRTALV